jgi:hypothetical protein
MQYNKCGISSLQFIVLYFVVILLKVLYSAWGYAVAQWLRHCTTNRKFAGSIPDGVIGTFH